MAPVTASAEWKVESPAPPDPNAAPDPGAVPPVGDAAPSAGPGELPTGWTETDVAALIEFIHGPYDKLAAVADDPAYKLSKVDEMMLVSTLTTWMPPSWVRAGARGQLPLVVALPITVLAIGAVNLPKLAYWNGTHPDVQISIPFISKRGGARRDRSRSTARDDDAGGGFTERDGGPGDRVETAVDAAASVPADASVPGGPPADSPDDIRRGYAPRR